MGDFSGDAGGGPPPYAGDGPGGSSGGGGAGILGALVEAGGAIYSAKVASDNTDKTIRANQQQAQYAYSQDLAAWNRQNAYNTPAAQMQRLKDAGLNPNLIYGNGSAATGQATQMPKYNAPTLQYNYKPLVDLPQMLSAYQDMQMRQAQVDNVRAQTENVRSRTLNEAKRNFLLDAQGRRADTAANFDSMSFSNRSDILSEQARRSGLETDKLWQQLKLMDQQQLLNSLEQSQREQNLTTTDLEQERKRAQLIFEQGKAEWMRQGITTGDHPALRIIVRQLAKLGLFD